MIRGNTRSVLLIALLATTMAPAGQAFQIREAPNVDQTYCGWSYGDCDDPGPFSHWFTAIVPWRLNQDAAADANDAGLTQTIIRNALSAAYQSWEDVDDSIISFTHGGDTSARVSGTDGISTSVWYDPNQDTDTCSGYLGQVSGTLAITISTIKTTGEITDVDIVYDSWDTWAWSTACSSIDIQSVATHEVGHMIGFGHTEVSKCGVAIGTKPTMCAYYGCDSGNASLRTLQPDDEGAAQCLYPELPTVVLIDQTGSMGAGNRMPDAQQAAVDFVTELPNNQFAVAAFAESQSCNPPRPGYELLQDWTTTTNLLETAILSTSPCGGTPMWESLCCALDKATEMEPANIFCITDTEENASDGDCGCTDYGDVLTKALAGQSTFYVIDITDYFGRHAQNAAIASDQGSGQATGGDGPLLDSLCGRTGGLYFKCDNPEELLVARQAIQSHIMQFAKEKQIGVECQPEGLPMDLIQRYAGPQPDSPFEGQEVTVVGVQTVRRGPFGPRTQYIEDCSGGIRFDNSTGPAGVMGEKVMVTGIVGNIQGEIALSVLGVEPLGEILPLPDPPVEDAASAHQSELIGRLVTIRGYAASPPVNRRFDLVSELGAAPPHVVEVFLYPDTGIPDSDIMAEAFYEITGIIQRVNGVNRLAPRMMSDVQQIVVGVDDPFAGGKPYGISTLEPNPFTGSMRVRYSIPEMGRVSVRIYDVGGKLVRTLVDQQQARNEYEASWDGRDERGTVAQPGVYFVRLMGPGGVQEARSIVYTR